MVEIALRRLGNLYLYLVSLLLGLLRLFLGLGSLSGGITSGLTDSRRLITLSNNLFPASTNNSTLEFGGLTGALLGDLLSGTLLVETTVEDGPVEFTGVLLGEEVGFALTVQETEGLAVSTDENLTVSRVDLGSGKVAEFSPKKG